MGAELLAMSREKMLQNLMELGVGEIRDVVSNRIGYLRGMGTTRTATTPAANTAAATGGVGAAGSSTLSPIFSALRIADGDDMDQ